MRSLYDCPEVLVGPEGVRCRVVVATHPADKKKSSVGVTRAGVVYELFFTNLPQQAFTACDVVELYLHRGAFEPQLSDEDQEIDPDRWCSHSAWGAGMLATGAALGQMDGHSVLLHGVPILSFVLGIMLGLVLALLRQWDLRSPFAAVFSLEALCLLVFLVLGSRSLQRGEISPSPAAIFYLCMVLLTLAMGLQTATVQRASGQGVRTTFMTGAPSDGTAALMQYLSWLRRQTTEQHFRRALRESRQQPSFRHLLLLGSLWGCYLLGAICGSALELRLALPALIFPVGDLAVLIVVDVLRPFES